MSDSALGDLCKCAHAVCEDKARQLQWGVIFQAYISPASNRIKNEAAKAKRLSNTIIQNAVYTILALLIKGILKWLASACSIMEGTTDEKHRLDANLSEQAHN